MVRGGMMEDEMDDDGAPTLGVRCQQRKQTIKAAK
jgi:hypothetical protein